MALVPYELENGTPQLIVAPLSRRRRRTPLPDRIHVEFSVRTDGTWAGRIDWNYTDTQSGKRFRSRREVLRFLEKENQESYSTPTATAMSSSSTPKEIAAVANVWEPESITWVVEKLNNEDTPIPYVNGIKVPEEIRKVWVEDFDRELNKSKSKKRKGGSKQSHFYEEKIPEGFI